MAKTVKKRGRKKKEEVQEEIPGEAGDAEEGADADDEEDSEQTDESAEVDLGDSDLELGGPIIAAKLQGNRRNGADIPRDVFPGLPIAPGGCQHQPALLINEPNRHAVNLWLAGVGQGRSIELPAEPLIKVPNPLLIRALPEAEHGRGVGNALKAGSRRTAHALRGRAGVNELRMGSL